MAIAVALPLFSGNLLVLAISAIGVGAVALGAVGLTSGAVAVMVQPSRLAATWGLATMAYAVMQAAGAVATFMTGGCVLASRCLQNAEAG